MHSSNDILQKGSIPMAAKTSVAIGTIEKANALLNQIIYDKQLDQIGLIVVDELHMLDGTLMPTSKLLTKLRTWKRFYLGASFNENCIPRKKSTNYWYVSHGTKLA